MEHDRDGREADAEGESPDDQAAYFDSLLRAEADDEGVPHPAGGTRMGSTAPRTWDAGAGAEPVDLGPGGSLLQRYRAAGPRVRWPLLLLLVLLLCTAAAACGLLLALWHGNLAAAGLTAGGLAVSAVAALLVARHAEHPAAWLRDRARREKAVARALRPLEPAGWVVLHDRLLPGTHHRIAHLAIGPTGVIVITPIPQGGRVTLQPSVDGGWVLLVDGVRYDAWHETRKWERDRVDADIADALADVVWTGPCYGLYVWLDMSWRAAVGGNTRHPGPASDSLEGFVIHPPEHLPHIISDLPATLGPDQVRHIAAAIETTFVPAGRAEAPQQHG